MVLHLYDGLKIFSDFAQRKCRINLFIQADSGSASIPCLSIKVLFFSIVS